MKVLLIHASLPDIGITGKRRRTLFPSLTLTYLAALFPDEYEIILCNDVVQDIPFEDKFDMVGITFYGIAASRAFTIARRFRDRGIPVVFGGPTATAQTEFCRPHCDCIVIGEAETIMPSLVADLESGHLAPIYMADYQADLTSLPVPRYDLLDPAHYMGIYPIQTARGCVFQCSYCSVPVINNFTVRYRPIEDVLYDIEAVIANSGSRQIFFVDDNINMNPKHAIKLFKALIPLRIEWYSHATSLIGKQPEVLQLAAESGCRMLFIGFESLNQDKLKNVNKPFNHPINYSEIITVIHNHGIHIMPSFIFGLDNDDPGVFQRTLEFLESNHLSLPTFHILTPTPGTEIFDRLQAENRILEDDLARFDSRHAVYEPHGMSSDELEKGFVWIKRRTYGLASILRRIILCRPIGGWYAWREQLRMVMLNFHYWRLVQQEGVAKKMGPADSLFYINNIREKIIKKN